MRRIEPCNLRELEEHLAAYDDLIVAAELMLEDPFQENRKELTKLLLEYRDEADKLKRTIQQLKASNA